MHFERLVATAQRVAKRGSRLAKIEELAELLRDLEDRDLAHGVCLLAGELPTGKIGVGYRMVRDALDAIGDASAEAAEDADDHSRIGSPAGAALELHDVVAELRAIGAEQGPGSQGRRRRRLRDLFAALSPDERDFLARLIVQELRQGALEGLMAEALARAAEVPAAAVRRAAMLSGDLAGVAEVARREGVEGLARFRLELFRPIQPMLASPVADVTAIPTRILGQESGEDWSRIALELKIDGARVQVHRRGEEVRVYSRQLNDVTASVPEVVEAALGLEARSAVLDGETFGVRADGAPVPFQETMRRFGRRLDVAALRRDLPLAIRFFDCLLVDDEELIDQPLAERWRALEEIAGPEHRIETIAPGSLEEAERFFERALELGHEGLMAKDRASSYEAGSRGFSWLKVKPAHTLDLVVLGVEWGSGRRQGWLSNLHLGARDEHGEIGEPGGFVMLGKTFKGLTDRMLAWQTERLRALALGDPDAGYVVMVRPELVVEIAFSNVQASPHYPAGMALRFARVKRYREDKAAAQASTLEEVRQHFAREGAGSAPPERGGGRDDASSATPDGSKDRGAGPA
ncbi:MAG TPA: ATP-dependent DNA ligase [Thermoanaerobaculia bacterium]|nr:ATP-dependent DNA ligase [Thermoanaerobaculia bacterium]